MRVKVGTFFVVSEAATYLIPTHVHLVDVVRTSPYLTIQTRQLSASVTFGWRVVIYKTTFLLPVIIQCQIKLTWIIMYTTKIYAQTLCSSKVYLYRMNCCTLYKNK